MKKVLLGILFLFTTALFAQNFNGFALYNEINDNTAYLIDADGDITHSWNCTRPCNYAMALKPNGNIVRGAVAQGNDINGPAVGGILQELDAEANIVWQFNYSSTDYVSHHDLALMPNGNVLLTAWDVRSNQEMQAKGFEGNSGKYPTTILEVQQNGTSAEIVWQWFLYDHLVQDVDSSLPNFGTITENPQMLNVNVETSGGGPGGGGPGGNGGDWVHVNGLDYNQERDQIVFSSRYLSEIFVIDHSTTTEEAAGSTGGNAGKGGDFLFRWGNPGNYGADGTQQVEAAVHDARWIPNDGRPNANGIMFFNNEGGPGGNSSADIIRPPYEGAYGFALTGDAYGPTGFEFRHACLDNANGQSSAYRLPNGNTYVNLSGEYMYEVSPTDQVVWQHAAGPAKGFRYTCDHPGVQALLNIDCNCDANGAAVMTECGVCVGGNTGVSAEAFDCNCEEDGTATLDACGICVGGNTGVSAESVDCNCEINGTAALDDCGDCVGGTTGLEACMTGVEDFDLSINVFPNPSDGIFEIVGLNQLDGEFTLTVFDLSGKRILSSESDSGLDMSAFANGTYFLSVIQENKTVYSQKISLLK